MLIIVINNLINNFGNKNLFKLIINLYYLKKNIQHNKLKY